MKKNNLILVVFISVLLIACAGIFAYTKTLDKCREPENNELINGESTENTEINNESKDFDIAKAEELLDYFGFNEELGCGSNIYSSFYDEDYKKEMALNKVDSSKIKKVKCSDIYNEDFLSEDFYQVDNGFCEKGKTTEVIPYEAANEIYKKMYGSDVEKTSFIESISDGEVFKYSYNNKLNSFVKLISGGMGGGCTKNVLVKKTKSAKLIGDDLILEVYYLHDYPFYNEYTDKYVYNLDTLKISKTIDVNSVEEFKKEVLNKYLDKLDVYEVKFEKNGNDYIFKSLSKKLS